ncbi:MAG: NUDIX domain-containing protein [Candidatus Pacebacteria bacterium]|nr:NUDIX domain-containing protein [Candidatus Paceibacterota bacterium]
MEMHLIQKHVLKALSRTKRLRYSDLKPPRIEGNQFSYHLKTLVRHGYIKHSNGQYVLTTKGVHFTTGVNFEHFFVRAQPKIVTLAVCENDQHEFLLYTRGKQPFLGQVGFPYGKTHLGESVQASAERELQEKTGFKATLTQKGIVYVLVTDAQDEIVVHMLCHVFYGNRIHTAKDAAPTLEKVQWLSKKEIADTNCMPGVEDILRVALSEKKGGLLFEELSFQQV